MEWKDKEKLMMCRKKLMHKADIYEQLQKTSVKSGETCGEFCYRMQSMARLADIDEFSHQILLCGAKTVKELTEKYVAYTEFKIKVAESVDRYRTASSSSAVPSFQPPMNQTSVNNNRFATGAQEDNGCCNCGSKDNRARECRATMVF